MAREKVLARRTGSVSGTNSSVMAVAPAIVAAVSPSGRVAPPYRACAAQGLFRFV